MCGVYGVWCILCVCVVCVMFGNFAVLCVLCIVYFVYSRLFYHVFMWWNTFVGREEFVGRGLVLLLFVFHVSFMLQSCSC